MTEVFCFACMEYTEEEAALIPFELIITITELASAPQPDVQAIQDCYRELMYPPHVMPLFRHWKLKTIREHLAGLHQKEK